MENSLILDNFDIYLLAPGQNVPLIVSVPTPIYISDGTMTIDFVEIVGEPHINGIEIIYIGPPLVVAPPTAPTAPISAPIQAPIKLPTTSPIKAPVKAPTKAPIPAPVSAPVVVPTSGNIVHRINCGTTKQVIVPPENIVWTPDQFSTMGLSYNTCGNITTSIYCTSRYYRPTDVTPYRYELPVAVSNRNYQVRLHFAEQVRLAEFGVLRWAPLYFSQSDRLIHVICFGIFNKYML